MDFTYYANWFTSALQQMFSATWYLFSLMPAPLRLSVGSALMALIALGVKRIFI